MQGANSRMKYSRRPGGPQRHCASSAATPQKLARPSATVPANNIATFRRAIRCWYEVNRRDFAWRRESATLYERVVSELLLQRTRAATVRAIFPAFCSRFPNWEALAASTPAEIGKMLVPLGLWRRRSVSLHALAIRLVEARGTLPRSRQDIEGLPGVGQYVANAILMFSQGRRLPLIDVNMARVLERYFGTRGLADIRYDPYLQDLAGRLVNVPRPEEMNWAILDFASAMCVSSQPECFHCPLDRSCAHATPRRVGARKD
jgi:A/G-specific adenine glycosylase